ncbi:MAG: tRNA pseudouridine32 synthase/23S rRNA pseudouridine746 synthase [Cyclobacteriaceae bacterium]|jgi:tRNA pseudouridine32 synthase/23S rRNA pseudouridine746 synthase
MIQPITTLEASSSTHKQLIFNFKADISKVNIFENLNNPFGSFIPEIARVAAEEFQQFIASEYQDWKHGFGLQKGKMFGILVVRKSDQSYGYLGTVSGKIPSNAASSRFVPSTFDDAVDDFFINRGMTELTEIGSSISKSDNDAEITLMKEKRKQKSLAIQQQLFENYRFLNLLGVEKNVLEIFQQSSHGNPPSAAGECTAPKLLHYAFKHHLKPIALAEFWWGNPAKNKERAHKIFYPACKNKCRPILEYMLNDTALYNQANARDEEENSPRSEDEVPGNIPSEMEKYFVDKHQRNLRE